MSLRELFTHPIIQAPMAGVATPALAAAVSNAGGLGSIGIATSSVETARSMIEQTRALTSRAFNVNVFCHTPARRDAAIEAAWLAYLKPMFEELGARPPPGLNETYRSFIDGDDTFRMLLAMRPDVVSFHFGLPAEDRLQALRDAGIKLMATATTLDEARQIEKAGLDAVVAQGIEAGGHRGRFDPQSHDPGLSTSVLVSLLVREIAVPVVAAGGIMDARGIKAALELGAMAAQMGTAFILCPETAADDAYRAALKSERSLDTRFTTAISGRQARGLANRFMQIEASGPAIPSYPVAYDAAKALQAAARVKGNDEFGSHWAGQGAPLAKAMPAGELVRELVGGLETRA